MPRFLLLCLLVLTACKANPSGEKPAAGTAIAPGSAQPLVTIAGKVGDSRAFSLPAGHFEFSFSPSERLEIKFLDHCPVSVDLRSAGAPTETRLYQSVDGSDITRVEVNHLPAGSYFLTFTGLNDQCAPTVKVSKL